MKKQYQITDITDETKLIRFLDLNGAEKSVGVFNHNDIECLFHYGALHHYQKLETNAGDAREGSISINLYNGVIGSDQTTNNALISCWSIWDGSSNPWLAFPNSSFSKDKNNICVIVSTVGKVRK